MEIHDELMIYDQFDHSTGRDADEGGVCSQLQTA
jgi:hypothetical protein